MAQRFSQQLRRLTAEDSPRTLQALVNGFAGKSFAVLFLLLMAIPALPLPTGGVTHVFEMVVLLLALELIVGRRSVWLPQRWLRLQLSAKFWNGAIPKLANLVAKVEKLARPRLSRFVTGVVGQRLVGVLVTIFTLFAFLAPPFSGLDTLPALGVVLLSLGVIFEDSVVAAAGVLVGAIGVGLVLFLGRMVFQLL